MKHGFLLVLLLTALCNASSETEKALDLTYEKAISMALGKNFQIQVQQFNPKIARAAQMTASGQFDPLVSMSYTYSQSQAVQVATVGGGSDVFLNQTGGLLNSSVTGLTPWGLTYNFNASSTQAGNNQSTADLYTTFGGLNITQPLLRGFGTDVNLAQIRIARADYSISEWQLRQQVIDVVTQTIVVYNDLHFAMGNLDVERRSKALAEQLYKDNQQRRDIGVMADLDVLQAKSDVANREERVLVAERLVDDNQNFLKQLVTDEISNFLFTTVHIAPPPLMPPNYQIDEKRDLAAALELRPDFRQALLDLQKRQINVVFRRNAALPQLDLLASFGLNGIDTNLVNSVTNLQHGNNYAWTAGGSFSFPIPNRVARGQLDQAKLESARALIDLKRLEQQIIVNVDNAAGQVHTTRKRIDATLAARELAEETLEAAQKRLDDGKSTTFEVLQFQRDLATAQIAEIQAMTDYNKSLAQYARETGTTLEKAGITVQPVNKNFTKDEHKKPDRNANVTQ